MRFTFVTAPPVEMPRGESVPVAGTNNESERALRSAAMARKTGRTSKTLRGARRQTVLTSVLESLRQYLPDFTLSTVVEEIARWSARGRSCFSDLLAQLTQHSTCKTGAASADQSLLEVLLPIPAD